MCKIKESTRKFVSVNERVVKGSFDADTRIGFNAVNFDYISKIDF